MMIAPAVSKFPTITAAAMIAPMESVPTSPMKTLAGYQLK